jgi:DNA helicase-2/ATP-dependent DNA helicase PcrA
VVIPFKNLEPKQQEIIKHEKGSLLVLAEPGTGKTEILTQRVAYLITKREVQLEKILAIIFSRKAAGEMKNRLVEFPGLEEARATLAFASRACMPWQSWLTG